jgi:hypothetical protein
MMTTMSSRRHNCQVSGSRSFAAIVLSSDLAKTTRGGRTEDLLGGDGGWYRSQIADSAMLVELIRKVLPPSSFLACENALVVGAFAHGGRNHRPGSPNASTQTRVIFAFSAWSYLWPDGASRSARFTVSSAPTATMNTGGQSCSRLLPPGQAAVGGCRTRHGIFRPSGHRMMENIFNGE